LVLINKQNQNPITALGKFIEKYIDSGLPDNIFETDDKKWRDTKTLMPAEMPLKSLLEQKAISISKAA